MSVLKNNTVVGTNIFEHKLINIITTIYLNEKPNFIEEETINEINFLLGKVDKLFSCKLSLYARSHYGLTYVPFLISLENLNFISGKSWAKNYFCLLIQRPDDMMELFDMISQKYGTMPNSVKKGFLLAFDKFDDYQLLKYHNKNKKYKIRDIINLIHPIPNDLNSTSIGLLMNNNFKNENFKIKTLSIDNKYLINKIKKYIDIF